MMLHHSVPAGLKPFLGEELAKKCELCHLPQNIWASGSGQETLCVSYGCKQIKSSSSGCRNIRDLKVPLLLKPSVDQMTATHPEGQVMVHPRRPCEGALL